MSAKIHGFGSVLGFLALTFAPLVVALFYFKGRQTGLALCALTCFILALVFFVLFVMADKPRFAHTVDRMGGAVAAADPAVYVSSSGTALCQRCTIRKEWFRCRR